MRGLRRGLGGTSWVGGYVEGGGGGYVGGREYVGGGRGGKLGRGGGGVVVVKSWSKMLFLGTFWKISFWRDILFVAPG